MPKNIIQKVVFKNTTPKALYDLYMDAKKHYASTGMPAKIKAKEGSKYSVSDGYIIGKNLQLIKDTLIVQTWRAADWAKSDADSTFIIKLEANGKDTILEAFHINVPDNQFKGIDDGWNIYYWKPWKQFLAGKKVTPPAGM